MTGVTRPRGPLPARVYWTRRLLVTLVALALVFGVARLLGGGPGGSQPEARAVGSSQTSSGSTPTGAGPTSAGPTSAGPTAAGGAVDPNAQPSGPCDGSDVITVPSVHRPAFAANPILITATLRTRTSPACTWTVSAASLVIKVTRTVTSSTGQKGTDTVWTTQQCRGAVPKQVVVLRRDVPNRVTVVWNGRRSDSTCSTAATWAGTGYYRVAAAAFGGNPTAGGFRLGIAPRATITATPTPTPTPTPSRGGSAAPRAAASGSASASASESASESASGSARASSRASTSAAPRATAGASPSPSPSRTPSAR